MENSMRIELCAKRAENKFLCTLIREQASFRRDLFVIKSNKASINNNSNKWLQSTKVVSYFKIKNIKRLIERRHIDTDDAAIVVYMMPKIVAES